MHKPHDRDEMLKQLSILDFMLIDLGLYLNSNPRDSKALSIFATVSEDAQKLRSAYEAAHGPLTARCPSAAGQEWLWHKDPWPWEACANFSL